jgi:hypothetical protein
MWHSKPHHSTAAQPLAADRWRAEVEAVVHCAARGEARRVPGCRLAEHAVAEHLRSGDLDDHDVRRGAAAGRLDVVV